MTLWQFGACVDGYKAANAVEETAQAPTAEEFFEQVARIG